MKKAVYLLAPLSLFLLAATYFPSDDLIIFRGGIRLSKLGGGGAQSLGVDDSGTVGIDTGDSAGALRQKELFGSFVVSGCLGDVPSAPPGLTHTPSSCIAYPGGYRVTETGPITYSDDTSYSWVILAHDTTGDHGTFTRVAGTHYLVDEAGSMPNLPENCAWLMRVTTAGGEITMVNDMREHVFTLGAGIRMAIGSANTFGTPATQHVWLSINQHTNDDPGYPDNNDQITAFFRIFDGDISAWGGSNIMAALVTEADGTLTFTTPYGGSLLASEGLARISGGATGGDFLGSLRGGYYHSEFAGVGNGITVADVYGIVADIGTSSTGSGYTITNAISGYFPPPDAGSIGTITNSYGVYSGGRLGVGSILYKDTPNILLDQAGSCVKLGNGSDPQDVSLCREAVAALSVDGRITSTGNGIRHNTVNTRPSCGGTQRGLIWVDQGGAGVADEAAICAKDTSDNSWWHVVPRYLTGTVSQTHGALTAPDCADNGTTIAVTGAADGDVVALGVPNAAVSAEAVYMAWVSAANTVKVKRCCILGTCDAVGPATFRASVWRAP